MRSVRDEEESKFDSFNIGGHHLPEIRHVHDTVLLSNSLQLILVAKSHSEVQNLFLNTSKTKVMIIDKLRGKPK